MNESAPSPKRCEWIAALVCSVLLLGLYAMHPSRLNEARRVTVLFYKELPRQGLSLGNPIDISNPAESDFFTPWTHATVRAMLQRWRVRDVAPHAMEELHTRWRNGPMDAGEIEDWREAFATLDAQWMARRNNQPTLWSMSPPELEASGWTVAKEENSIVTFRLTPPGELDTAAVGSRLLLELEGEPATPPTLYWTTKTLGESGFQRLVGKRLAGDAARFGFDLGVEPGWLAQNARAGMLRIDVKPGPESVSLVSFGGADAPELLLNSVLTETSE